MKKSPALVLVAAGLLALPLMGCGSRKTPETTPPTETAVPVMVEETIPATTPPDGNPTDVTCKGSYTGEDNRDAVVAQVGSAALTNDQLQAYYWAEVASYCRSGQQPAPDLSCPLDTQACTLDGSVNSWQQFFLRRALNTWHTAQALILQGQDEGLPAEEAYEPNLDNYERYLTGMPATQFLYRYQKAFQPNTMHQAYLDGLPQTLMDIAGEKGYSSASAMAQAAFGASEAAVASFAEDYNRGYMYYTNLSYYITPTEEELAEALASAGESEPGIYVDIRHILLLPQAGAEGASVNLDGTVSCTEEQWLACEAEAESLLQYWVHQTKATDATFAALANQKSADPGSAADGGAFRRLQQGQLVQPLDDWCFDTSRQSGDTTVLRTETGVHVLYFVGSQTIAQAKAEDACIAEKQADILTIARSQYPIEIDYRAIVLGEAEGTVALEDVLYPDIAHQRFPEVPLYLQQDYPRTYYGNYLIRTNGCGITSMAMVASYLTDTELTPPEMCDRYGRYSFKNGTDGMIFVNEPPVLGFYFKEKTYDPAVAKAALEDGHVVISIQHKGYWTGGGHYIVLEKVKEDGTIQVRDSNIFNYQKLKAHKEDGHTWGSIVAAGSGFWIFEKKLTAIDACARCGTGNDSGILVESYLCEKCTPALLRRGSYLSGCGAA